MTINLTHLPAEFIRRGQAGTRMIIMKLIVCCDGQLMCHGELHLPAVQLWQAGLTAKIKIINR